MEVGVVLTPSTYPKESVATRMSWGGAMYSGRREWWTRRKQLEDSDRAGRHRRRRDRRIKCYDITAEDDWAEVSVEGMDFVQDSVVI